jgi:DUSP domain
MISQMERQVSSGSTWFIIGNTWFEAWRRYVFDDVLTGESPLADLRESELSQRKAPGPITNEDILMELPKGQYLLEVANATKWQNTVLKPDLKEGAHFMLVDEIVWDRLKAKYDMKGP